MITAAGPIVINTMPTAFQLTALHALPTAIAIRSKCFFIRVPFSGYAILLTFKKLWILTVAVPLVTLRN